MQQSPAEGLIMCPYLHDNDGDATPSVEKLDPQRVEVPRI